MDYLKELQQFEDEFEFQSGVSDELISNAEKMLGVNFPDDYKQFLSQVGNCNYGDTAILGIYVGDSTGDVTYSSVDITLEFREDAGLDKKYLVIQQPDIDFLILYNVEDKRLYDAEVAYEDGETPEIVDISKDECKNFKEFFEEFLSLGEEEDLD